MFGREPEVFGEWLLVHRLAESQMAEAVVGVRLGDRSGRTFVVKRPLLGERASGPAAQAIRREAEVLGAVRSAHLVALEASGTVAGLPFIALEHVRGVPLDRLLTLTGALPHAQARAVAADVLAALGALHEAGWVHGDVAPSNVIVDEGGEARLLDLGIAARTGEVRPMPAGKPGYIAPEAIGARPAAPPADVYAWAVVISECLLGRRLFVEHDLSEAATRDGVPPAASRIEGWGELLGESLALDPARRPAISALRAAVAQSPLDRAGLAATVARAQAAPDRRSSLTPQALGGAMAVRKLTPTAPLVVRATVVEPVGVEPVGAEARPPDEERRWPHRRTFLHLAAGAACAGAGWLLGRRGGRRVDRGASMGLSAALPARARLAIDGRVIAPPEPGKEIPVTPGRHTVSITLPRRDEQTFDVVVGEGEHVVLLVQPGGAGAGTKRNDRRDDTRETDPREDGAEPRP